MSKVTRKGLILVESEDRTALVTIRVTKARSVGESKAVEEFPETVLQQDGDDLVLRIVGGAK